MAKYVVLAGIGALSLVSFVAIPRSYQSANTIENQVSSSSAVSTPQSGEVLLGIFMNTRGGGTAHEQLLDLEKTIGRKLAIEMRYDKWDSSFSKWYELTIAEGRIPMISWTVNSSSLPEACATSAEIVSGKYDDQLVKQAGIIKGFEKPVMMRWFWEMTSSRAAKCFYRDMKVRDDVIMGKQYVDAWKHIVDLFRREGVTNALWVWAPGEPAFRGDQWKSYYPGNDYVDWVASDNYNKDHVTAIDFGEDEGINAFYNATKNLGKPLMISETGGIYAEVSDSMSVDPQTKWIASAQTALPQKFPLIKGFLYWDAIGENDLGKYNDYVMRGPGLDAWKQLANDPYFSAMTVDGR